MMGKLGASGPSDGLSHAEMGRRAWARRHPVRAKEERSLRKARAKLLDRWHHKNAGTPETHEAHHRRRAGAIARLHASGYLSDDELAWSQEIAAAAERIMNVANVRTCSLEARVDGARHDHTFHEALGAVWSEMTYSRWRAQIGADATMLLDVIVHDVGLVRAAAAHGMHVRRARKLLVNGLHQWARIHMHVRREVSEADVAAAQAGLL